MEMSGRFRGIHALTLDSKGRFVLPTRYRAMLHQKGQSQWILTIDTEYLCLLLYPISEWELIETKLQSLPMFQPEARRIQRLLIGHATELETDSHGRLRIPSILREYAQLNKSMILIGQGKRFELWDAQEWEIQHKNWLQQKTDKGVLPNTVSALIL